jgi:hypothetical protein
MNSLNEPFYLEMDFEKAISIKLRQYFNNNIKFVMDRVLEVLRDTVVENEQ